MRYLFLFIALGVSAADWPTYRADSARSGVTKEQLKLPLQPAWAHQPQHAPRPAWRGPAKKDMYNDRKNRLKNRQLFDHAFHVAADARHIYFGSSADDQVHCLDATTGKERWSYFTEGPVRLAPTLHQGKLYFGSDDGHAYCITTEGKAVWRQRLAPRDYRIAGNNRIISAWPVRTGVLVRDGKAYAGAGMFPSEGVHIYSLNADDGSEAWSTTQNDLPAQGFLLVSNSRVYVPAGRNNPVIFDRKTGKRLRAVSGGGGGTFALLAGEDLVFGPGRTGQLGFVEEERREKERNDVFATFSGSHMIVAGANSYLHANDELYALDRVRYLKLEGERKTIDQQRKKLGVRLKELRKEKSPDSDKVQNELIAKGRRLDEITAEKKACVLWRVKCAQPHALILVGDTLFAGGYDQVVAYSATDGQPAWQAKVNGAALGLAAAHGRLLISTHKGTIHCFTAK
jgi:outer membrane protein assembly factor BamB